MKFQKQWFLTVNLMAAMAISLSAADRLDRTQGRSMVVTAQGIVASEHPLASQAGAMILASGGSAVDAAVAANAMIGLVGPMMCGMGGDLFAIIYDAKTRKVYGLNASGWAPAGLTPEFLRRQGISTMPQSGINSVTVPGAVDGWDKLLKRFGRKKFSDVLAPSIAYAERGFPVSELDAGYWSGGAGLLRKDTNAARTYLPGGHAPKLGEFFKNPDLAWSYREVAAHGRAAFYEGKIAERLLRTWKRLGGKLDREDLKEFSGEWVDPISTKYRDWTVYEIPPNGQGIAALMMLNLMEHYPIGQWGPNSADALHVMIEAKKLAYADMHRYVADPRFSKVPVHEMLSKSYATQRARTIDLTKAKAEVAPGQPVAAGSDTTYLCAVDKDGNMISLIQSNYGAFGSGVVADGTGFVLQNRGGLFSMDPQHPNILAGRKRPQHTIIPGLMVNNEVRIAFGIMGGWNQSQAHAQFVSNIADHHMNVQAALEAARFTKLSFEGNDVQMESRIPVEVRQNLEKRGHQIQVLGSFAQSTGGGQAVRRDFSAGVNFGGSDPRKDGSAIPEPMVR